jgi:hypothetical protein
VADTACYTCQYDNENISFKPTFLFQSTIHKFTFTNKSNIHLPIQWIFEDVKRGRGNLNSRLGTRTTSVLTANSTLNRVATSMTNLNAPPKPCPFSIEPESAIVSPNSAKQFTLTFHPTECEDFIYFLKGDSIPAILTALSSRGNPPEGNKTPPNTGLLFGTMLVSSSD